MNANYKTYLKLIQSALKVWKNHPRCVICGNSLGARRKTREHVPPQGIYIGKIEDELLTVPCCEICNGGTSDADRAFKYSLALFCQYFSKHQTTEGSRLYALLRDRLNPRTPGNLPEKLKNNLMLHYKQPGLYRHHQWWPRASHDPIILKIVFGLFWLYREGEIFLDRSYSVLICRDIDFSQNSANNHLGQSFPGIKIQKGQFVAHHIQSFEASNSPYSGVFGVSLHFHSRMKLDRGYHVLVYCIPLETISTDSGVEEFMKAIGLLRLRQDKVSKYIIQNGEVSDALGVP